MYKDKDKQREADRERQKRYRTKRDKQGVTKGVTSRSKTGVTNAGRDKGVTITKADSHVDASDVGAVKTLHRLIKALPVKPYQMTVMERLFYRPASKLGRGETNFVSLPGRACYGVV